jgi:Innexin
MDRMISTVAKLAQTSARNDDDIVDRLHHRYTVLFLIIFTVVVSTTQYVGTPIHCWSPAYFSQSHERYTDRVCIAGSRIRNSYNKLDILTRDFTLATLRTSRSALLVFGWQMIDCPCSPSAKSRG